MKAENIKVNIKSAGMSFLPDTLRSKIEDLSKYINVNHSKKASSAKIVENELFLKIYGGLDDSQIEKIQDNFSWINGLEYSDDETVVFSLDL